MVCADLLNTSFTTFADAFNNLDANIFFCAFVPICEINKVSDATSQIYMLFLYEMQIIFTIVPCRLNIIFFYVVLFFREHYEYFYLDNKFNIETIVIKIEFLIL